MLPEDELSAALREAVDAARCARAAAASSSGTRASRGRLRRAAARRARASACRARPRARPARAARLECHPGCRARLSLVVGGRARPGAERVRSRRASKLKPSTPIPRRFVISSVRWSSGIGSVPDGFDRVDLTLSASEAANASAASLELAIALAAGGRARRRAGRACAGWSADAPGVARCLRRGGSRGRRARWSAQALELIPDEPTPERARVLEGHARLLLLGGRVDEARDAHRTGGQDRPILGARDVEAAALTTGIIAAMATAGAVAAGERGAARRPGGGRARETLVRAYINAGETVDQAARVAEAVDLALEGLAVSRAPAPSGPGRAPAGGSPAASPSSASSTRPPPTSRRGCAAGPAARGGQPAPGGGRRGSSWRGRRRAAAGRRRRGRRAGCRGRHVERARRRRARSSSCWRRPAVAPRPIVEDALARGRSSSSTRRRCTRLARGRRPTGVLQAARSAGRRRRGGARPRAARASTGW